MQQFLAHFITDEPVIVSDGTTEGMRHSSLPYVPGTMLLGALAGVWKRLNHGKINEDSEFDALFLHGAVAWGHAVPSCAQRACLPIPASWEYVKNDGCLPSYGNAGDTMPRVFNLLCIPDQGVTPTNSDQQVWQNALDEHLKRKRHPEGFVDAATFCMSESRFVRTTHVALNVATRTAQEGHLFSYEAIAPKTVLCSRIVCQDEWAESVKNLLQDGLVIQVGHSRSAGYGSLRLIKFQVEKSIQKNTVTAGKHTLLLESDYFPAQSWRHPLDALQEDLRCIFGTVDFIKEKSISRDVRLEGFNSLWMLPRASRCGLHAGSVLTFIAEHSGVLPAALGGWQQEGYGRVLCDPDLLNHLQIKPKNLESPSSIEPWATTAAPMDPFVKVWRHRSLERLAREQALRSVWGDTACWNRFFKLLSEDKPSQSQRGNIRRMLSVESATEWCSLFSAMLKKTPGKQWENVNVYNPFKDGAREKLSDVMLCLLDCSKIDVNLEACDGKLWLLPVVAGGQLTQEEEQYFRAMRHQRLLLNYCAVGRKMSVAQRGKNNAVPCPLHY